MSTNTKIFGIATTLEHNGKTYKLPILNIDHFTKFEAWIEEKLWAAHRRSVKFLPQDEYAQNRIDLLERIGKEQFSFPQPAFFEAMTTMEGMKKILFIGMQDEQPDIDEETVSEIVQKRFYELVEELTEQQKNLSSPMTK